MDPNPDITSGDNTCDLPPGDGAVELFTAKTISTDNPPTICADPDGVNVGLNPGSNVHVQSAGELRVITPVTGFAPGFKVDSGGVLKVYAEELPIP